MKKWTGRTMVILMAWGVLFACDSTNGTPCDQKGSTRYVSKERKTYHCKHDISTGGNTWQ